MGRKANHADGSFFSRVRMGEGLSLSSGDEAHKLAMRLGSERLRDRVLAMLERRA